MLFSSYMDSWLYGKGGYYEQYRQIGKSGDFYTAVSTSAFFGAAIAEFLHKKILSGEFGTEIMLVEIGAHKGYLISDMIRWLYTKDPSLIDSMRFATVERYDLVAEAQERYFYEQFGDEVSVQRFSDLAEIDEDEVFFVANEIFDAFACDLFFDGKIADVKEHKIVWKDADKKSLEFASKYNLKRGEIATGYESFAEDMISSAKRFGFVTFDYGEEYVRNDFSIRVYKQHKVWPLFDSEVDLAKLYQQSDITYDVNFAHLFDAFGSKGIKKRSFMTQARALVEFGIIDILHRYAKQASHTDYLAQADRVKTLISPTIMGDKFKMVYFASDIK